MTQSLHPDPPAVQESPDIPTGGSTPDRPPSPPEIPNIPARHAARPPTNGVLLNRISTSCSMIAAIIGGLTILGWVTGFEGLASLRARWIPMAPSTALCFAMLGVAIIVRSRMGLARWYVTLTTGAIALVATAKLVEFISGHGLGLDELLVADPAMFGPVRKGRMAPLTAFNFLQAALALFCLLHAKLRRFAGLASVSVTTISIVVLLGYMHGTPLLYGGSVIPVALPTAIAFFCIGCALVTAAGFDYWPLRPFVGSSARSLLLRWFLPVVIAGTLVNGYLQSRFLGDARFNPALVSALSTLGFALLISAIIFQVAQIVGGSIDRAEAERNSAQKALKTLNADLEQRIAARTIELRMKNDELQRVLADLTHSHEELKRAQLQLIQAEKMQSVGSLAAGIAHEVKNPLAILEMGLGCLTNQPDLDEASLQIVYDEMRLAVQRANSVISGLLNYSSSRELDIGTWDLQVVLDNALHLVRHELMNHKVTLVREFASDSPHCLLDPQKIEQVFVNLFTNACHAMPKGGTLTVRTYVRTLTAGDVHWDAGDRSGDRLREDEHVAVVEIRDTGSGIPPDKVDKIFDPFFTTKPTGQGTGLGLTVARKIVDLHGGRLELTNAPGGGALATITLRLPPSSLGN